MKSNRIRRTVLPLGLAGAVAIAIAAGTGFSPSAVVAAPAPDKVATDAKQALAAGKVDKAIAMAEGLVAANPREAGYRALLGQAYLRAGRFESAAQSLDDAMKLGDNSTRTALSLSLAYSGMGRNRDAVAILDDWRDAIPAADLGLAYALAGDSNRGVSILADALRGGENTPKLRQNLAYAYALDGRWREARQMAAQDVPADKLDARISSWAEKARPEDNRIRVASMIGAPVRADRGMPAQLALNASSEQQQLAVETSAQPANGELPAAGQPAAELAQYKPVEAQAGQPAQTAGITFTAIPVIQAIPASSGRALAARGQAAARAPAPNRAAPRRAEAAVFGKGSSHAVQLGSFSSEQGARRAWGHYVGRNPELRNFRMTVTPATVRGKQYWRVAAAGLDGRGAGGLCAKVKSRGGVCFAYATTGDPAGAPALAMAGGAPAGARRK